MTPLILNYDKEPEYTLNNNSYNRCGPTIGENDLNRVKDMLEVCAVAGGHSKQKTFKQIFIYTWMATDLIVATNGSEFPLPKFTTLWE